MDSAVNILAAGLLEKQRYSFADTIVERQYQSHPELIDLFGAEGKQRCREDVVNHLKYLQSAVELGQEGLFINYLAWAKIVLDRLRVGPEHLLENIKITREVLSEQLSDDLPSKIIDDYLVSAIRHFDSLPPETPSLIREDEPLGHLAHAYMNALLSGQRQLAREMVMHAIENGIRLQDIYLHVFQRTQHEIGRLWQLKEISIAKEHFCTAVTQSIMAQLYHLIFNRHGNGHTFVGACVGREQHEMGLRMVSDFLEMSGWNTYFLGANVPSNAIIETLQEQKASVLGLSITMSFHLHQAKTLIQTIREQNDSDTLKIIVGGYPFHQNRNLWKKIGADGWAQDAEQAVLLMDGWLKVKK